MNDEIRGDVEARLGMLLNDQNSIYGALLSSIDGHHVASVMQNDLHTSKLAAMTSSVIALGESLAKEAEQSQCQHVIVQNSDGYIVTQRLGHDLALTVFATTAVSMGMLVAAVRSAVAELQQILGR